MRRFPMSIFLSEWVSRTDGNFIYVDIVTWVHRVIPKVMRRGSTQTSRRSGSIVNGYFRHKANVCAGMDEPLTRWDGNYWIRKFGWVLLRRRWTDGFVLAYHWLGCECGTPQARSGRYRSYLVPHLVGVSSFIQCVSCRTGNSEIWHHVHQRKRNLINTLNYDQ